MASRPNRLSLPTLHIVRGLPGSGRSTLAKLLAGGLGVVICPEEMLPADFSAEPFSAEHNSRCNLVGHEALKRAIADGIHPVVLDRPHTFLWEMRGPVKLAQSAGYEVVIHTTVGTDDPARCARSTKHKVEPGVVLNMATQFEPGNSVEMVLESVSPFQRMERAKKLWDSLPTLSPVARAAAEKQLLTEYSKELATLTQKHGLLKDVGWPNLDPSLGFMRPRDSR